MTTKLLIIINIVKAPSYIKSMKISIKETFYQRWHYICLGKCPSLFDLMRSSLLRPRCMSQVKATLHLFIVVFFSNNSLLFLNKLQFHENQAVLMHCWLWYNTVSYTLVTSALLREPKVTFKILLSNRIWWFRELSRDVPACSTWTFLAHL